MRNGQETMLAQKFSGYTYGPTCRATSCLNENVPKGTVNSLLSKDNPLFLGCHEPLNRVNLQKRSSPGSWLSLRANYRFERGSGKSQQSNYVRSNRFCAYYKSEEYDITGTNMDALTPSEGASEAVVVGGNIEETYPWWEQFPKRWVIVLLCFASFLLCNMDRVSVLFALQL